MKTVASSGRKGSCGPSQLPDSLAGGAAGWAGPHLRWPCICWPGGWAAGRGWGLFPRGPEGLEMPSSRPPTAMGVEMPREPGRGGRGGGWGPISRTQVCACWPSGWDTRELRVSRALAGAGMGPVGNVDFFNWFICLTAVVFVWVKKEKQSTERPTGGSPGAHPAVASGWLCAGDQTCR